MIVSGYSMILYCEVENTHHKDYFDNDGKGEYTGETHGECAKQARKDGWLLTRDRRAYCKEHRHMARKTKESE